ncbi:hypothetical protein DdX_13796 [Ditylenchus destructor]|uniref:Uncharacterized protein n=1 Tax=Ditylenchus destructor TaxID=166010 RepID=A0AAD4MUM9_9BILA|nr:hypothetical protein DdX_13796 [Ditylenchus destructor]
MNLFDDVYSSCNLTIAVIHLTLFLAPSQFVSAFTPVQSFLPYMSGTLEKWYSIPTGMQIFDHNARKFYNERIQESEAPPSKMAWTWPTILTTRISTAPGEVRESPTTTPAPIARRLFQKHRQINTLVTATFSRHLSGCYIDGSKMYPDDRQVWRKNNFSALFDRYVLHRHNSEQRNFAKSIVCE